MARILKTGGLCVLTVDLDLLGNLEIGIEKYDLLVSKLMNFFDYYYPETTIHPANMLHSNVGPYPLKIKEMRGFDLILEYY